MAWADVTQQSSREQLADYLELRALVDPDHCTSSTQLLTDALMGGLDEDPRDGPEPANMLVASPQTREEGMAAAALASIERRIKGCGLESNYPFTLSGEVLSFSDAGQSPVYPFLLCLSTLGGKAPEHHLAAKLFEELSAIAAESYLGHEPSIAPSARSYVFGFPRRRGPADFAGAVRYLCGKDGLNESKFNASHPKAPDQKDARLDIVAWRDFPDGRRGRVVLFGQCATGADWEEKAYALKPDAWREKWLMEQFLPTPTGGFFVPHFVEDDSWNDTLIDGGLLFERCRITALTATRLPTTNAALEQQLRDWLPNAIEAIRAQT